MVGSGFWDGMDNGVGASDFFMENMWFFDFPMESLEGDDLDGEDWIKRLQGLGPIPSEALLGSSLASRGNVFNAVSDVVPSLSIPCGESSELKPLPNFTQEASRASIPHQNDYSDDLEPGVVQVPSPVSVLESSSSSSGEKSMSMNSEIPIPVRPRTRRSRSSTINPWLEMPLTSSIPQRPHHLAASKALPQSNDFSEFGFPNTMANPVKRKLKKKKKLSQLSGASEMMQSSSQRPVATKKCSHCQVTRTPQWREGPMGPRTLCNACGVRNKSGRLFPEYRPVASPTFIPSLHSNSHKKVVEMRTKSIQEAGVANSEPPMSPHKAIHDSAMAGIELPVSPPPEFIPMSSYMFDCILGSSGQYS